MNTCPVTNKIIYRSVRAARSASRGIWLKKKYPTKRYVCPYCNHYHLTTAHETRYERVLRLIGEVAA